MKKKPSEFIMWCAQQIGNPYMWGGNGESTFDLVRKLANSKGQNSSNTQTMLNFMENNGFVDCRFYDCSGLVVTYFLAIGAITSDMTANDLYKKSTPVSAPIAGCLAFLLRSDGTAYHVGIVDGDTVIQALDQSKGVVREVIHKRKWVYALPEFAIDYTDAQHKTFCVGDELRIKEAVSVYNCAYSAKNPDERTVPIYYPARTYYVYKIADGCVNITRTLGVAGGWLTEKRLREVLE